MKRDGRVLHRYKWSQARSWRPIRHSLSQSADGDTSECLPLPTSRKRNEVESFAAYNVAPRAAASSPFSAPSKALRSKNASAVSLTFRMRVAPPTTSTRWIWCLVRFAYECAQDRCIIRGHRYVAGGGSMYHGRHTRQRMHKIIIHASPALAHSPKVVTTCPTDPSPRLSSRNHRASAPAEAWQGCNLQLNAAAAHGHIDECMHTAMGSRTIRRSRSSCKASTPI